MRELGDHEHLAGEDPATGRFVVVDRWGKFTVERGAEVLLERYFESYDPAQGLCVLQTRFVGDEILFVYNEKHHTIAWVTPERAEPDDSWRGGNWPAGRLIDLGSARDDSDIAVGTELLAFGGGEPGVIELRWLPSLAPGPPVPISDDFPRGRVVTLDDEALRVDGLAYDLPPGGSTPSPRGWLVAEVADRLARETDAPLATAELFAGAALGRAFAPRPAVALYDTMFAERDPPTLHWLPVYEYERLQRVAPAEASAYLALLDRLAGGIAPGPWEPIATAATHVRRRAATWARLCRGAQLPVGQYCHLWDPHRRAQLDGEPAGLRHAFEASLGATSLSRRQP